MDILDDEEGKSDGLEILSIGALYTGPWHKKYWSSSRGKDRYPYPVGYQALQTYKGLTYKMEIQEGSKGPKFQITSNEKQIGSGETPDRAWENLQKKCCPRIKLWHGKRFSGKLDGVEFFGFKNALVQRLLRELVATVNHASDHSSALTDGNEASLKGKRSKISREIDTKSASKNGHGRSQPLDQGKKAQVLFSTPGKMDIDEPLTPNALSDCLADETLKVIPNIDLGQHVMLPAQKLPVRSHEVPVDSKAQHCLIEAQSELRCIETCAEASSLVIDLPQEDIPEMIHNVSQLDRQCAQVQVADMPVATDEGNEKIQVSDDLLEPRPPGLRDSLVNHYGNLCVPDSYDSQQEFTCAANFGSLKGEQVVARYGVVADLVFPEEAKRGSLSEEGGSYLNGNSDKSDFDSIDEDITKTMMAILLPRAMPSLTCSSRKRRRKNKLSKDFSFAPKEDNIPIGAVPSAVVKSSAGTHACLSIDGQTKPDFPRVVNSGPSMMENYRYIVPDSLDNDHHEYHAGNELLPSDTVKSVAADLQKDNQEPDEKGLSPVFGANESSANRNETAGCIEILPHKELQKDPHRTSQNDSVLALDSAVPCRSSVPLDLVLTSEDKCLINADVSYKPIEHCIKNTDLENTLDCKGPRFIPVSGKQESSPANTELKMEQYGAPLSESIICRNYGDNCVLDLLKRSGDLVLSNPCQVTAFGNSDISKASYIGGQLQGGISNLQNQNVEDALAQNRILQDQTLGLTSNKNNIQVIDGCNFHAKNSDGCIDKDKIGNQNFDAVYHLRDQGRDSSRDCVPHIKEDEAEIISPCLEEQELNDEIKCTMKFIGCYSHPMRISSILLSRKPHEIHVCVSCGIAGDRKGNLFLYKLSIKEPSLGSPCMVGHSSMSLPSLKDEFGREVAVDKSALQFTPDARGLVLVDSIRMPYCRAKNLHCLCTQCELSCFEENAVKIVTIKLGYVSLVLKLKTMFPVHCVLVCEPENLIAVDESGRIYIWIMNSTWSVQTEVYVIPSYEFLPSRVVELKRISKSASMVVGHNGYGEFSLWDISKRSVISRFSAPASLVLDFLPVCLFSWPTKGLSDDKYAMEGCVKKLEEATMLWFSRHSEAKFSYPREGEDIAVWLLICTSSDSAPQSTCHWRNCQLNSDGYWRLGLLIKDTVILGSALYSSTTAIGTSSGTGIIGTQAGRVYIWDLATGTKLEALHDFEGNNGVSHIATDDLTSSVVAIAGDGGQLCVYLNT